MEQRVDVGIVRAKELKIVFNGTYIKDGEKFDGERTMTLKDIGSVFFPKDDNCFFTLKDVVIGIGFHWERNEDQSFRGALKLIEEEGMICAVNIVPIETYLTSVISSEMSANASLELLKAHAVISRSWVLSMIEKAERANHGNASSSNHEILSENTIVRWYDSEAHKTFHVCADDHCQRYQGITRQSNPNVVEAIKETRGQVLTYDNKICDARFSKCCGGMMEEFQYCWENIRHPYLVAKADPYCNTRDKRILSQVLNNYDQETTDFYRWMVTYSADELSELVKKKSGIDFGKIQELIPVERGASDRIVMLKIVGEKQTVTVGKELEIRKWLSESHLYSSAFTVEKTDDTFILHGKGWGHGVGLCQIGAAVMGEQGIPYREILSHYYPNANIETRW